MGSVPITGAITGTADVTALEQRLDAVESGVNAHATAIDAHGATLSDHETRLDTLEAAPPASSYAASSKSLLDFNAVGNGVADDTDALIAGFNWAFANKQIIRGAGGTYKVTRSIVIDTPDVTVGPVGFAGENARIISTATDGLPVIQFTAKHALRGFRWDSASIKGNALCGDGLVLLCDTADPGQEYFWNFNILNTMIENCARGLAMIGNVFEGTVGHSYFQDNRGDGAYFAHLGANAERGVCSAIWMMSCNMSQNGGVGVRLANHTDGGFNACVDVNLIGGYIRENWSAGVALKNGLALGREIYGVGFENNWMQYPLITNVPAGTTTANVHSSSRIAMRGCGHYTQKGGAKYAVTVSAMNGKSLLDNVSATDDAGNNTLFKLSKMDGTGTCALINCTGAAEGTAQYTPIF